MMGRSTQIIMDLPTYPGIKTYMRKLVNIFIAGVQKGGTSSLHEYLCAHPALSPPASKELHFFDDETQNWEAPDYTRLHSSFSSDDETRQRFESTPIYGYWPPALPRIQRYHPGARLIFLFRDPFERAVSQWYMANARRRETMPFAAAIRQGRYRLHEAGPLAVEQRVFSYIERGFYAPQIERALALFPREQLLFLKSEDFFTDPVAVLDRVARFLEIPAFPRLPAIHENARLPAPGEVPPSAADLALVAALPRTDLRRFADLAGLEISHWPTWRGS